MHIEKSLFRYKMCQLKKNAQARKVNFPYSCRSIPSENLYQIS